MTADTFPAIYDRIRDDLLAGRVIRILDIPRNERPAGLRALADKLRELADSMGGA